MNTTDIPWREFELLYTSTIVTSNPLFQCKNSDAIRVKHGHWRIIVFFEARHSDDYWNLKVVIDLVRSPSGVWVPVINTYKHVNGMDCFFRPGDASIRHRCLDERLEWFEQTSIHCDLDYENIATAKVLAGSNYLSPVFRPLVTIDPAKARMPSQFYHGERVNKFLMLSGSERSSKNAIYMKCYTAKGIKMHGEICGLLYDCFDTMLETIVSFNAQPVEL